MTLINTETETPLENQLVEERKKFGNFLKSNIRVERWDGYAEIQNIKIATIEALCRGEELK